ncbi:glycosyltransferase family 2 protein [Rosistilla oblonga]|uniref:glycosyltransferase family 2 protein n=1 Tax=Rosistilla oblonga TaxID=2527990 RepID=UPI003A96B727
MTPWVAYAMQTEPTFPEFLTTLITQEVEQGGATEESLPPQRPHYSVIVPCYNEAGALPDAIVQLRHMLIGPQRVEMIVVDDGSTDGTAEKLQQIKQSYPDIVVLTHPENRGYGAALKTGIRHASAPLIVITDADGTYPNQRIGELVKLAENYDMVVGSRTGKDVHYSKIRSIPKFFLKGYASWIANRKIPDLNSGLRVFKKETAEKFIHMYSDGFSFTTTSTLAFMTNGHSVHYEPISYAHRIGQSKIKPIRDTLRFVQLIMRMGMYFAPLRVLGPFCALMLAGFTISLGYDVFFLGDLTEKTLMLLLFGMNTTFFALLADMIDKRSH